MTDALKQPEALRLANELANGDFYQSHPSVVYGWCDENPCSASAAELRRQHAELRRQHAEIDALRNQRNMAVSMLAEWCRAVDKNGTGWDDWDEYYKDAAYRPGPLRELIDIELAAMENTK